MKEIGMTLSIKKFVFQALSLLLLCATPGFTTEEEASPIHLNLVSEETSIQPGRPFCVGIHLQMQDGWHTYWKNPGDVGMATSISWELPEGFSASSVIWPVPEKFTSDAMTGYGYRGEVLLMTLITPPHHIPLEFPVQLKADVKWLVCSDSSCVPGNSQTALNLPVGSSMPQKNQQTADLFSKARAYWPKKITTVAASLKGELIQLNLPVPKEPAEEADEVFFFPEEQGIIDHSFEATLDPSPESPHHSVLLLKTSPEKTEGTEHLKGLLVLMTKQGETKQIAYAYEIDTALPPSKHSTEIVMAAPLNASPSKEFSQNMIAEPPQSGEGDLGFSMALLLAFVGGMILNLMPCVLPVISLKILSFVKMARQSRVAIFKHGLSFSLGVLVSFWILAGILLLLQMYGHAVGWGFQLQEPLFVAFLSAFLLMFAFSLFGMYELGDKVTSLAGKAHAHATGQREGHTSSFLSGVFATAVATPCTGPFLGSVVGLAVTVSPIYAMFLFTSMGMGMAFPYLVFALFPALLKYLPKPGPWMDTFKQLMGFLMVATVLWLVWVFSAQTDSTALVMLLISFFLLSIGCWAYGKWGTAPHGFRSRASSIALAAMCFLAGGYLIVTASKEPASAHHIADAGSSSHLVADINAWEHFSPERLSELQRQGKPVLVDFTAKWCLTCQANRMVLMSDEVETKLADLGVVKMEADWTRNDPKITHELRKYGRNGVPLYLLFTGDDQPPKILPQMLTPSILFDHLEEIESEP